MAVLGKYVTLYLNSHVMAKRYGIRGAFVFSGCLENECPDPVWKPVREGVALIRWSLTVAMCGSNASD